MTSFFKLVLPPSQQYAAIHNPGVPKVGFVAPPQSFEDITGCEVRAEEMDVCARVISVFKCHKACPLTAASSISVAALIPGTIVNEACKTAQNGQVRVGHPAGVMTMYPYLDDPAQTLDKIKVTGVAVRRTARRIMDGTIYLRK